MITHESRRQKCPQCHLVPLSISIKIISKAKTSALLQQFPINIIKKKKDDHLGLCVSYKFEGVGLGLCVLLGVEKILMLIMGVHAIYK